MFGLKTLTQHNEAMAGLRLTIEQLRIEIELQKEAERQYKTMLADLRSDRDIALRRAAHADAEVAQLTKDIAGLLPDAEKHRRSIANLKNARSLKVIPLTAGEDVERKVKWGYA